MPERAGRPQPPPGPAPADAGDHLEQLLTEAVLAVPGVVEIEPDLGDLLRLASRQARNLTRPRPNHRDATPCRTGLSLSPHDGQVDVEVDIAVAGPPALHTAHTVRQTITESLRRDGHQPGRIAISVLRIDDLPDNRTGQHGRSKPMELPR